MLDILPNILGKFVCVTDRCQNHRRYYRVILLIWSDVQYISPLYNIAYTILYGTIRFSPYIPGLADLCSRLQVLIAGWFRQQTEHSPSPL